MREEKIKFIKKGLAFGMFTLLLLIVYLLICMNFSYTPNHLIWFKEAYKIKDNIAKNIEGPKIVIVAGSNAHFGISAEKISEELGIPVVNYGVAASLKTYHFKRAKKILNPGDVVYMPLEYEFFWHDDKKLFDEQPRYVRYILTYDKKTYNSLPFYKKMIYHLVQFPDLYANIKQNYKIPPQAYDSKTINEFGDETAYNIKKRIEKQPMKKPEDFSIEKYDGPKEISEFIIWCQKNNITVIASFPPTVRFDCYFEEDYEYFFSEIIKFYEDHHLHIHGSPQEFFHEIDWFYDTIYHLKPEKKEIRTKGIIKELAKDPAVKNLIKNKKKIEHD